MVFQSASQRVGAKKKKTLQKRKHMLTSTWSSSTDRTNIHLACSILEIRLGGEENVFFGQPTNLQNLSFLFLFLSRAFAKRNPFGKAEIRILIYFTSIWIPKYRDDNIYEYIWRACSRLYRILFLRYIVTFLALFEIWKIYALLHR